MILDLGGGLSGTSENVSPILSTTRQVFLDHLGVTGLRACFEFWRDCRQGDCAPLKARIDPVAMPRHILPNLFIYELVGCRFRCRLAGTEFVAGSTTTLPGDIWTAWHPPWQSTAARGSSPASSSAWSRSSMAASSLGPIEARFPSSGSCYRFRLTAPESTSCSAW